MKTLIQIQDAAIAKLDVTRSSDLRYKAYRASVARWFRKELAKIGYTPRNDTSRLLIEAIWQDVKDMSELSRMVGE